MSLVIFVYLSEKAFPQNGNTVNNSSGVFWRHLHLYVQMSRLSKGEGLHTLFHIILYYLLVCPSLAAEMVNQAYSK